MILLSRQSNPSRSTPPVDPATASPEKIELWWVAVSRPRYEQRLAEEIRKAAEKSGDSVTVFAPREEIAYHREGKGRDVYSRPLFPSYVFYRGDRDVAFASSSLIHVLTPTPQDDRKIDNLLRAYEAGPVRRSPVRHLRAGMAVKVVSGPAAGVEGVVEKFGETRVYLDVGKLGVAEIDVLQNQIEPLWGD